MSENRAIKRFIKTLERIKGQITDFDDGTPLHEIKASLSMLQDEWREFQNLEKNLKGKFDDANLESVDKIENYHFELKQKLFRFEKLQEENAPNPANKTMDELVLNQSNFIHEISNLTRRESEIRLPRVNIPLFSGKYSEFPAFRDLFESSVHLNNNISKVHKLQYLKSLLKGDAYSLINHLAITEANYEEAWGKVKERYDKRKHVVNELLKQFMEQPRLEQGCRNSLRRLADVSDEVIRGLRALGEKAESRDPWIIYMLINKLDIDSKQAWAHETAEVDFPTLAQLFKFLNKRSDALESLDSIKVIKPSNTKRVSSMVSQSNKFLCPLCSSDHYIGRCDKFLELPIPQRKKFTADKKLCFNCLSSTHQSKVCRSRYNCRLCKRRHHVLLHLEEDAAASERPTTEDLNPAEQSNALNLNAMCQPEATSDDLVRAILPTAQVIIKDKFGKLHRCRALLDSGSQSSFVSENCVQRLQLPRQRANISITGITAGSERSRGKTMLKMASLYDSNIQIELNALIINQLPSKIPGCNVDNRLVDLFKHKQLADPDFSKSAPIDILIGADRFFTILQSEQQQFGSTILQKTVLGWIVTGQPALRRNEDGKGSATYTALSVQLDMDIDSTLRRFWEMEETPKMNIISPEEAECEEFFKETLKRQEDGRYIVRLPFKDSTSKLGDSLIVATQRFLSLERKLSNDVTLREQYNNQMNEYIKMGHMVEITKIDAKVADTFYLPHHAVEKVSSETTKIRVVFDGSSRTTTGISLNNILMVGPTIQPTLWNILMRFRCNRVAITADVEKMYRQIIVCPDDTNYQRLLWRESSDKRLRHYKLTRVTFGLACSAFLAIRTLQQLAQDKGDEKVIQHTLNDFYVDDFLSGADDVEAATQLKDNMMMALQEGGFVLRKWRSNSPALCEVEKNSNFKRLPGDDPATTTVLGLHWNQFEDTLTFQVNPEQDGPITKRKIISEASRVFDPLGFISPSIILMKIIFQKLWLTKLDWDDQLPRQYEMEYRRVREEFKYFQNVKIPRFTNHYDAVQIHGFSDASEVAYCAVVYSRVTNEKGEISINLLTSKTKVAPIKRVSLPRLELCAAHLLSKLMYTVKQTTPNSKFYAWTDSAIVLAWLSTYPARWKTFVANRTSDIIEKFPRHHWSHVRSADNPADYGSRGVYPQRLITLMQWWCGPDWLKQPENHWPITNSSDEIHKAVIEKEQRRINLPIQTFQTAIEGDWLEGVFEKRMSITTIYRIIAYVRRFITNIKIKSPINRVTCELTSKEIEAARTQCIKWVQGDGFGEDITSLFKHKMVNNKSKLRSLAPFIDAAGILRVGGRLENADCDYEYKHPVILPANHLFTERLIWDTHCKNLHAGPTSTNHLIRQKYWIVNGRSKIRFILNKCVVCVKYAYKTSNQLMGNLPAERVTPTRPFTNCGIDFAGPLYFATKKGRGGTNPVKGYLCIFVCLSVKAIHIEPVSDMTSEAFLAALKRFAARRGVPKKIYSDNGSNFIGAKRILNEACNLIKNINQNYILSEFLSSNSIDWHFIPPASPHFGGLWESSVKSVKTHLLKSTKNVNLTFEEMATLLCQIENILNSRPICATSTEDDYEVLTPAHFLIGISTGSITEKEITAADSSLSRWHRIQARIQSFWRKYRNDYLNTLQQRHKWQKAVKNLEVNDIVLVKEDNTPTCKWPLGKVIQLHPGNDNLVRVVTIKTASSVLQRPVIKLIKLPVG